ncbi:outer membrane beta-barrel protein [Marivirga tractuosa]|uniref:outer membrane beta-barrel protein n=1 Tax=Marivirga tractuosa TaxID=1006 RepID=UPI0035D0A87D
MKRILILFIFSSLFVLKAHAQVKFEKGYYVDNQNDTVKCLVKNKGWTNFPESFTIKINDSNEKKELSIDELKMLRISDEVKFINTIVKEDISDNNSSKIAYNNDLVYTENVRLLKVLVESEYSLYFSEKDNRKKFFYSGPDNEIRQLIDKRYYVNDDNIATSQEYIKQLLRINECQSTELNNRAINDKLNESNLIYYFEQINNCLGTNVVKYEEKNFDDKSQKSYSVKLGLNLANSQYIFRSSNSSNTIDFPSDLASTFGIELEIPIKANKFKWSLITEPTFKYIASSNTVIDQGLERNYEFQVYSLDIPLGIRYKFYLSDDLLIFLNFKTQLTLNMGNSFVDLDFGQYHDAQTKFNLNAGFGFKWKKLILEYRRDPQNILNQRVYEELVLHNNTFIIGYTFLKK